MRRFMRAGLAVLFLDELIVGGWNAVDPAGFYRNFPTVDLTPPFSEHYARDFGTATLGIAALLLIAVVRPEPHHVIPATTAFSIFAVPHFLFHLTHLGDASASTAVVLTAANAIVAILGLAVLLVSAVDHRRRRAAIP